MAAENAKNEILGNGGTYTNPKDKSALKEIRDSREAIKSIESNMNTAVKAAGQIDSFRSEITKSHDETINARNEILGSEDTTGALEEIRNAKNIIVGESGSADNPNANSALDKVKKAQDAAEKARSEAEGFAASANKGITVINDLNNDSATDALSAQKGKELNDSKLDKSGGTMTGTLILNGDPSDSKDAATKNYVDTQIAKKVDKVDGKGLSTNDYTDDEKTKLAGLENYTLPTASDKVKGGIKVGAGLTMNGEVLSATGGGTADAVDWSNVTNKPETFAPSTHTHTASEVTELATVATSGSYNDLSDKPTDFAPAAHTHEMTDIIGLSDALDGKSDTTHNHDGTYLKSVPIATKDTLGGIKVGNNLSITEDGKLSANAQKIDVDDTLNSNSVNPVQNKIVKNALDGKSDTTHNHDGTYLKEVPKATKTTLGVIKVGNNLSITEDGTLSANAQKIDVDSTLNSNSVNPVQNKIVKNALDGKSDTTHNHDGTYLKPVDVSTSITENSTSAVSSGAVYTQLSGLKFVVSKTAPTSADDKTFTIVVPN